MRRRTRFLVWVFVVVAALGAPAWLLLGESPGRLLAASWEVLALAAMLWLLVTTPTDALKLDPWVSGTIVAGGAVWLLLCLSKASTLEFRLIAAGAVSVAFLAMSFLSARFADAIESMRHESGSFWAFAPVAWHPCLWMGTYQLGKDSDEGALSSVVVFVMILATLFTVHGGRGSRLLLTISLSLWMLLGTVCIARYAIDLLPDVSR